MLPTTTDPAAAELQTGMVILTGPAVVFEVDMAASRLAWPAAAMSTSADFGLLAALAILPWVVALLVMVAGDVSRAVHHRKQQEQNRGLQRQHTHHHVGARR